MVAINSAILHDVIERLPLLDLSLTKGKRLHAGGSRKRQRDDTEVVAPVRRSRRGLGEALDETPPEVGHTINMSSSYSTAKLQEMKYELLTRSIALLYFQHGN